MLHVVVFNPSLTTAQTVTIKDDATITVSGGGDLSGTAHFQPFSGAGCAAGTELGAVQDVAVWARLPRLSARLQINDPSPVE